MKYLIVQEWKNTKGNHAGMKHMCDLLARKYPEKYRVISRSPMPRQKTGRTRIANFIYYRLYLIEYYFKYVRAFKKQFDKVLSKHEAEDEFFLMEYMLPMIDQLSMAKKIREVCGDVRIYGMAHLTPSNLSKCFNDESKLKSWAAPVDKVLTLGTSLGSYLESVGIPSNKISIGFHYVDSSFYHKSEKHNNEQPVIIVMGNLQRNYDILAGIIRRFHQANWIICAGMRLHEALEKIPQSANVRVMGYISENQLRNLMDSADISLNVMDDTVGSNVITTSMAMGLAMVVSDVGSIRDYCDDSNAIFCENTTEAFVEGITKLISNETTISSMQESSLTKSKLLSIENIDKWFSSVMDQ
jgi:glycosyltransferase involved in cell wall biosynthesis